MRRSNLVFVLSLLSGILTICCQKAGKVTEPLQAEAPADVIATVTLGHPAAFATRLGRYVDALAPGMGASVTGAAITQLLGAALGASSLDGIDLEQPLRVIVFDPKARPRPLVLLATFPDAEKLGRGASGLKIERDGALSLVGAEAEVTAAKAWALGSLARQPAPEAPTAELWVGRLVERYHAALEALPATLKASGMPATIQGVLQAEIDAVVALGGQSERAFLSLDVNGDDASVLVALAPKGGTTFAKFVQAQKPLDPRLLGQLVFPPRPTMVMVGNLQLRELADVFYGVLASVLAQASGRPADEALRKAFIDWFAHYNGGLAAVAWREEGLGTGMTEILSVDDGPAAQKAAQAFFGGSAEHKLSLMGMDMTITSKLGATEHAGVSVDTFTTTWDPEKLMPMQREMLDRMYPGGMKMAFAGFGQTFAMSLGAKATEQLLALADATNARGHAAPFAQAALDGAAKAGDSMVLVMDLAGMMPFAGPDAPASQTGLVMSMGFSDGRAGMRLRLPAAHIAELKAALAGAGRPPR